MQNPMNKPRTEQVRSIDVAEWIVAVTSGADVRPDPDVKAARGEIYANADQIMAARRVAYSDALVVAKSQWVDETLKSWLPY